MLPRTPESRNDFELSLARSASEGAAENAQPPDKQPALACEDYAAIQCPVFERSILNDDPRRVVRSSGPT